MQRSDGNNHGKIFVVENDIVNLWSEIEEEIIKYKNEFLR